MYITQATIKGQVLIPVDLRKKYHIHKGSRLGIIDRGGEIMVKPLPKDIIQAARGFLKGGPSALKMLLEERRKDCEREERKYERIK
jgi:AbrB family looped-hinge helix DNA binding protein